MEIIKTVMPYIYGILVLGVIIAIVNLLIKLSKLADNLLITADKLGSIEIKTRKVSEATDKIAYTARHSLPLFVGIISVWTVLKAIIKDYKKTDKSKRSIVNSSINTAIRKPATVSKAFSSIKNF